MIELLFRVTFPWLLAAAVLGVLVLAVGGNSNWCYAAFIAVPVGFFFTWPRMP